MAVLCDGAFHPLFALARTCGGTPASIRARLAELAGAGLPFRALQNDGAQLPQAFVALDADAIQRALDAAAVRCAVNVATVIDSTNSALLRESRGSARAAPADAGSAMRLLAAEFQSAGRGRHGRSWHAPPGAALTVSWARRFDCGIAALGALSLVCGLALRSALLRFGVATGLKWPNDVLFQGRKIAGVLVEVQTLAPSSTMVVVGMGINVAADARLPQRLEADALPPTDLGTAIGHGPQTAPVDRNALLVALTIELDEHLRQFEHSGFAPFVSAWNTAHAWRNQRVELRQPDSAPQTAYARDVNEHGHLRIDTPSGPRWIFSGDVSIRPCP